MAKTVTKSCGFDDPHSAHRYEEGNYTFRCAGIEEYNYQDYSYNNYDYKDSKYNDDWDD